MEYNILVVEDESGIRETIKIFLENQGYHVFTAQNGVEGLEIIQNTDIHLAVVDIMMPVMDGMTMVLKLREKYDMPVIFLSAKSEDIDKIKGLNVGADDYITKPFEPLELIARVNSNLRRYTQILKLKQGYQEEANQEILQVGDLVLNKETKQVTIRNQELHLTLKEFQILELFMSQPGRVFSSEQIYESVWKEMAVNTDTIMVHIRRLRKKIEEDPKNPEYIKVVWGIGYKIEKM
ncbi:MAG: response regulator transcription factor [Bacillota bacterium]|uniref:response regulator transcription factor n=1 Tax=Allobaculum stercoricanis TaxID=174709 RepID=UPI00047BC9DD|nr:response regulator transcription factor [Allobaculum stercoricanis]MDO5347546.1 response regulator transcription factor [Bacillota bacterium]